MGADRQIAAPTPVGQFGGAAAGLPCGHAAAERETASPWIWRACSGFSIALAVPVGISTVKDMRAIGPAELGMTGTWRFFLTGMGILAAGATLLQVYNVVVLNAFWAFFATIVVQLVAGILQFVRLILLPLRQTT